MSAFIPTKGTYFYVRCTIVYEQVVGAGFFGEGGTVVKSKDNSYSRDIFICAGRDDAAVVGIEAAGNGKRHLFLFSNYAFTPVGPEIIEAMGLAGTTGGETP